jgi:DNA invertase Pin-like site-specific DNA recombinase
MPTKAVSYLRVSGKGQIDGDGFPRQREAIQRYAKSHRMTIVDEFTDGGVSGKNELEDRPGLGLLIFRIEQNGVRVVLVETAMRLARDLMVGEIILDRFRKLGVKVIEVAGGNDLTVGDDNPTSRLIRQILGAVAEFEKSVLVGKLRAARQRQRLKHGRCEGRKPFGTFPGEAEVVERIKDMRRKPRKGERLSFAAIAEQLNEEGVPTRSGKPWRPSTVGNILGRE